MYSPRTPSYHHIAVDREAVLNCISCYPEQFPRVSEGLGMNMNFKENVKFIHCYHLPSSTDLITAVL